MAFGEQVALEPFQAPDRLVHQPADLRQLPGDRLDFVAEPVVQRVLDPRRHRRLEFRGSCGETLQLRARPLERGLDRGRLRPSLRRVPKPLARPLDRVLVHPRQR